MKTRLIIILAAACALGACATSLKLSEAGEKVRVLDPDEVGSCRNLGRTNTAVTWAVLGVPRAESVVLKELQTVARNSASSMGGDTIVPLTVMTEGKQTFVVYKCINPDG